MLIVEQYLSQDQTTLTYLISAEKLGRKLSLKLFRVVRACYFRNAHFKYGMWTRISVTF